MKEIEVLLPADYKLLSPEEIIRRYREDLIDFQELEPNPVIEIISREIIEGDDDEVFEKCDAIFFSLKGQKWSMKEISGDSSTILGSMNDTPGVIVTEETVINLLAKHKEEENSEISVACY